jgi:protein-disulfide isomerase
MDENLNQNKKGISEKFSLPLSIIVAGLLIAGGIYLNGKITKANPTSNQQQQLKSNNLADLIRPIDASDHILGSADARIVVVEYSDTECPFCKNFHATMNSIMQEYGKSGQVAWIYRHYPIAQLHPKSFHEAVATECAASLGGNSKFWEYINKVYEVTPSNNGLDPAQLGVIAKTVGLSSADFDSCLTGEKFAARVNADIKNAGEIGIGGTPYSIIIDTKTKQYYPIEGAYPLVQVKSVIDMILKS